MSTQIPKVSQVAVSPYSSTGPAVLKLSIQGVVSSVTPLILAEQTRHSLTHRDGHTAERGVGYACL